MASKSRERIETSVKRPGGPPSGLLPGAPEDVTSPHPDPLLVTDAVKHWVAKEGMVLNEIEDVLHGARKRLDFGRRRVQSRPAPRRSPEELIALARPKNRDKDEIIPNPDFWADWLARGLALCFPRQEELQEEVLRETAVWARSRW